jgi:hypothetical protein
MAQGMSYVLTLSCPKCKWTVVTTYSTDGDSPVKVVKVGDFVERRCKCCPGTRLRVAEAREGPTL